MMDSSRINILSRGHTKCGNMVQRCSLYIDWNVYLWDMFRHCAYFWSCKGKRDRKIMSNNFVTLSPLIYSGKSPSTENLSNGIVDRARALFHWNSCTFVLCFSRGFGICSYCISSLLFVPLYK